MGSKTDSVRTELRFILNDETVRLEDPGAGDMLLGFLREKRRLTGTKEGCNEGDCGACTVLVGRRESGSIRYRPVNACIRPLASLDLCHVVTVEHLGAAGLHPVQDALHRHHASQCGFCTPGIVMALAAHRMAGGGMEGSAAREALQGNLCRCTGYAPILRAMGDMAGPEPLAEGASAIAARLKALDDGARVETGGAILPADLADFARLRRERPEARVVAGATDVGLWITKQFKDITPALHIGHLEELARIERMDAGLRIGAGVTYADLFPVLADAIPAFAALIPRIGGPQIRAAGTLGGNIANGSPIGDLPPPLIALGATLTLRRGGARRELPLEDFFLDYGKQDLRPGEFVEAVTIPDPGSALVAVHKLSKRREEDITAVLLAARIGRIGNRIASARIAFGGMAGIPKRARAAEAALTGAPFTEATFRAAAATLEQEFTPLSDMRASAQYRMLAAGNLLLRVFMEAAR